MSELPIEPGDVCIDLTSGRTLHVMSKAADRADEWSRENNYELCENYGNERLGAQPSDTVWTCVYANSIQSEPSKDYAFPESRLARVETERATSSDYRVQDEIRFQFAVDLLRFAEIVDEAGKDTIIATLNEHNSALATAATEYVEAGRIGTDGDGG